jgi:acetoin utilization deacetylase AcuC-like enzyme
MHTTYIIHEDCLKHEMGADHPKSPARMHAIQDQLIASGLLEHLAHYEATKAELVRVHSMDYIERIFSLAPQAGSIMLDDETSMNPYTLSAALHAAGAVIQGVDLVMSGAAKNAFCNIRPPGHHARRASASGFCIFNNVAVAAAHALEHHGLQRVAIADFDVHHGDGTEDIFHDDPRVMLYSRFIHH